MNKEICYVYFKSSIHGILKNKLLHMILICFEYLSIYSASINSASKLYKYGQNYSLTLDSIFQSNIFSPFQMLRKVIFCNFNDECLLSYTFIIVAFCLLILFWIFGCILKKYSMDDHNDKKPKRIHQFLSFIKSLMINFYDLLFFRYFSIFVLDIFITGLALSYVDDGIFTWITILSLGCFILYISSLVNHLHTNSIWIQFNTGRSSGDQSTTMIIPIYTYPYDRVFSSHYEIFLALIKILICLESTFLRIYYKIEIKIVFLNVLFIILIIYKAIDLLYSMFIQKNGMLLSINEFTNGFRMFFILLNFFTIPFTIYYAYEPFNLIFVIIIFISLILMSILLLFIFWKQTQRKKYNGTNYICHLYCLIKENFGVNNTASELVKKIKMNHTIECKAQPNECSLCNDIKINKEIGFMDIFLFFYHCNRHMKHGESKCFRVLIKLIYLQMTKNNFKLFSHLEHSVKLYKKSNKSLIINLLYLFDLFVNKTSDMKNEMVFTNLIHSQHLSSEIEKFIIDFKTFVNLDHSLRLPQDFILQALALSDIRHKFTQTYKLTGNPDEYRGNTTFNSFKYNVIIERYILESILNRKFTKFISFDIEMFEDLLDVHFKHDKNMLLSLKLYDSHENEVGEIGLGKNNHMITIINCGGDLIKYKNQNFESIFPEDYRKTGKMKFLETLNMYKNTEECSNHLERESHMFEFIIKKNMHIEHFKLKFKMFPYLLGNSVIIQGDYSKEKNSLIIFETKEGSEGYKKSLHSFSEKIGDILFIHPLWIRINGANNKFLWFDQIFKPSIIPGDHRFSFEYKEYKNAFIDFVCPLKDELMTTEKEIIEINEKLSQIQFLSNVKVLLKITQLFDIAHPFANKTNKKYQVFAISDKSKVFEVLSNPCKNLNNNENYISEIDSDDEANNQNPNMMMTKGTSIFTGTNTSVPNELNRNPNLSIARDSNSSLICSDHDGGMTTKTKKWASSKLIGKENLDAMSRKFNAFKIIIFAFNIATVIISIIFFILQRYQDSTVSALYDIFSDFQIIRNTFTHSTLSILANVCVGDLGSPYGSNAYVQYSQDMGRKGGIPSELDLYTYIMRELKFKLDKIQERFYSFQQKIFDFNKKDLLDLLEINLSYIVVDRYSIKEGISAKYLTITFKESMERFINSISIILHSAQSFDQIPVYIISMKDIQNIDFSNIYNKNINEVQQEFYHVIMNYDRYIASFKQSERIILTQFNNIKYSNEQIINAFTIIVCVMNFFLLLCGRWYISMARAMFTQLIHAMLWKINNPLFFKYFNSKLSNLKVLCRLYEENPNELIGKIESKKQKYKNTLLKNLSNSSVNGKKDENVTDELKETYREYLYDRIMNKYSLKLMICFGCYFVFIMLYNLILSNQLDNLYQIIEYSSKNAEMATLFYNDLALVQLMALTNRTDIEMKNHIYDQNNSTSGYVFSNIETYDTIIKYIEISEFEKEATYPQFSKVINYTCNQMFYEMNDSLIYQTSQRYGCQYFDMSVKVCNLFEVMKMKNLEYLFNELNYLTLGLLNSLNREEYKFFADFSNSYSLFDLYSLTLFIFRPIRDYMRNNMFLDEVNSALDGYSIEVATYIAFNILIDIIIFMAIQTNIMTYLKKINKDLLVLSDCLQF